jgi:hypothetical protein
MAYTPEYGRYGTGASLAVAELHFAESSRIALGLITAGADRVRRQVAAFCALVLAWHGTPVAVPDPHKGHEPHYRARRTALHELAGRMAEVAAGAGDPPGTAAMAAWWRSVSTLPDPAVRDLCAHLLCNRLGVGVDEEHRLRYLARRTVTSRSEVR